MGQLTGFLGIAVFLGLAILLSRSRKAIHWKTVGWALILQWIAALFVLKGVAIAKFLSFIPWPGLLVSLATDSQQFYVKFITEQELLRYYPTAIPDHKVFLGFGWVVVLLMFVPMLLQRFARYQNKAVSWGIFGVVTYCLLWGNLVGHGFEKVRAVAESIMRYAADGARFVFGDLANPAGPAGMVFAFVVLPTIIFIASIFAILYYLGIMQWVVGAFARALNRFLKVSGAESVCVAASILMGQTEAPLTVRPYLAGFTRSELMTIMTAGMAHVSGAIMVAYVQVAHVDIVHLLTAVIMTAPGAIMMAKIMEPETEHPVTAGNVKVDVPINDVNIVDAAARGAGEGMHLAINVGGMLIAFIALVALCNGILVSFHHTLTLENVLGTVFRPFAFLMGVPWGESKTVGALLGQRMVVNEFVAFISLGKITVLSDKARLISTFALCGFANFSSIAIQVGGIGALVPERRSDLARLGLKAMLAGTMANFLSACIAGILM